MLPLTIETESIMSYVRKYLGFFLLLVLLIGAGGRLALADVMISPIYVIFDERARAAEVTLLNTTNSTNVYRLEWSLTQQKEDGSYQKIETLPPGQIDPRTFIRFSPRQVTLLPQSKQKIRLQLQKPADLPDGEYRVHLNFKRLPNDSAVDQARKDSPRGLSMELRVFLGISMPVVVRHGAYDAQVDVADARFVQRKNNTTGQMRDPELMVKINRTGKHGTYGRLRVFWENGGQEQQVGTLNNFSIFADNPSRIGYVPLNRADIPGGRLRIVYEGDGPQRGKILTEQTINIGG